MHTERNVREVGVDLGFHRLRLKTRGALWAGEDGEADTALTQCQGALSAISSGGES